MESIRNPLAKPPKYIDVDYMTLPNIDNNPLFYDEDAQEILDYWTDGKMVYWGFDPVSKDVEHFVWFNRLFAKVSKHCFLQGHKLRNVDHTSFTALNNCYARDCKSVWTTGGRFEPEDISSFVVCDDGVKLIESSPNIDFGGPGPLGSFMEKFYHEGYEEELVASLKRKPTEYTIALMFRIIADKKNPNLSEYKHLLKTLDCTSEIDTFWLDEIAKL